MLIRFLVKNLFSFKEYTEINMLPGNFRRLEHHIYKAPIFQSGKNIDLLKLNGIYGANGSGKSNLIRCIGLLQQFITTGVMPIEFYTETFKFDKDSSQKDVYLGIEFINEGAPYYYGVTINQGIVIEEELQISALGKGKDHILFSRTDSVYKKQKDNTARVEQLDFGDNLTTDESAKVFPEFLKNEILERNQPVLFHLKNRQNKVFWPYVKAAKWFDFGIQTMFPVSFPARLALKLEQDESFLNFSVDIMRTFKTGIHNILVKNVPIDEFFGEDDRNEAERLKARLKASPAKSIPLHNGMEEVVCVLKDGEAIAKVIKFTHIEDGGQEEFRPMQESDGTRRLMDYLPVFYDILNHSSVYILDEIERSIHPVLIKELIRKFSLEHETKGQLIFSTHESNLLDQDIFRPDEIWFAEKDMDGSTKLYALSEFKEHHTIDIRKGYLNGRYGAIPFMGNLQDLSWNKYAKAH